MAYLIPLLFSIVFVELFLRFGVAKDIGTVMDLSRQGIGTLTIAGMDDDEKEALLRRRSKALFKATFVFTVKLLGLGLILFASYLALAFTAPEMGTFLLEAFQSATMLVLLTAATLLYVWVRRSLGNNYGLIDRFLHHLAFSTPFVQQKLVELENDFFSRRIEKVTSEREIFITGLPRSGTTLLLTMLYNTKEFVTYTYRHMPFVLSPLLWGRISRSFRKNGSAMERAHGDGMMVSVDSPEAFEEVVWLFFMKARIVGDKTLSPLSVDDPPAGFAKAFRKTIRKLLAEDDAEMPLRYLSKNNANISRIGLIQKLFPSALIVIPFRQPRAQVKSLMAQHRRFTALHETDKFSKRYMKWLGHYDFGANFKPINFDNWLSEFDQDDVPDENFWLDYWTSAYTHVLDNLTGNIILFDFDKLIEDGENSLRSLADRVGLENGERLVAAANVLRSPTSRPLAVQRFSPELLETARRVHQRLKTLAI